MNLKNSISVTFTVAYTDYSPTKETEIRTATVLNSSYDPVSRPHAETHIKAGLSILAIDDLVSFVKMHKKTSK